MALRRVAREVRDWVLRRSAVWERLGFHVTPANYFSPIPPAAEIPDELFERRSECVGLDWNDDVQRHYLRTVFPRYALEAEVRPNRGLSLVDAAILHAMIRHHKPRRVIEIGGGASTTFAARAVVMNRADGVDGELITVDPYPAPELRRGMPGLSRLVEDRVQAIPPKTFAECDMVVIDSTHVVRIGGDVTYELLEAAPRVKAGCLLHFHDILLPGEYWREWVKERRLFWSEQYLLQAFLAFNREFVVAWASRYMHLTCPEAIREVFPDFEPDRHRITSFWIQRR